MPAFADDDRDDNGPDPQEAKPLLDSRDQVFYPGDTERIKPLSRKLFSNILMDQKEIWTSPFRMSRGDSKYWIGFTAATAALIATDNDSSTIFRNSNGQIAWGNRVSKIGASWTLIPLVAGFYGYGVLKNEPKPREVGVLGAEALLDSLIVVEVLKPIAGRVRPDGTSDKGHFFSGGDAFPSGHAIESWSLASLVAHEYGRRTIYVPIVAYSLASVVSVARYAAQRHYASDIVAGGAMGWFIGRYVYKTHQDHLIHGNWQSQVAPMVRPSERSFGVTITFAQQH